MDELVAMYDVQAEKAGYDVAGGARRQSATILGALHEMRGEDFGNACDVRNLFEHTLVRQSNRLMRMHAPTVQDLMAITVHDLPVPSEV